MIEELLKLMEFNRTHELFERVKKHYEFFLILKELIPKVDSQVDSLPIKPRRGQYLCQIIITLKYPCKRFQAECFSKQFGINQKSQSLFSQQFTKTDDQSNYFDKISLKYSIKIKQQMQLIPLQQTIEFNATATSPYSPYYFYLLAFAYHPVYHNLLYLFYSVYDSTVAAFTSQHLLLRDSNTNATLQNTTITENYQCSNECEMKTTESLLLIESASFIGIYSINSNDQSVFVPAMYQRAKVFQFYLSFLSSRLADIYADKYVVLDYESPTGNVSAYFGSASSRNYYFYNTNMNNQRVYFVGLSENEVYAVVSESSNLNSAILIYDCLACIYSGQFLNNSNFLAQTMRIGSQLMVNYAYRLYQGRPAQNANVTNGKVYIGVNSARQYTRLIMSGAAYLFPDNQTFLQQYLSTANHNHAILFGVNSLFYFHAFNNLSDINPQTYSYTSVIAYASISSDSSLISFKDSITTHHITQYQIVSNCSDYFTNATSNPLFCTCLLYNSNNRCKSLSESGLKGTFPIAAVIAVVAGLVLVVLSIVIIKKNYKRCTKGRRRTPWKYNPVELMSFES